ncbi:MAG: ATP-binding protein [Candidatus Methanoplasma sp.]|jgi:predicted AAA+ superfamily ATPase|nr:ATP-binding protein [Candidatus Methanoplasma sp.]
MMEQLDKTLPRKDYLKKLAEGKDRTDTVKIVTGMRRCGKSVLMRQFIEELKRSGVGEDRIFYLNFESEDYQDLTDYKEVTEILRNNVSKKDRTYVLFDEIQRIDGWEKNINALMVDYNADIYITGSNAYLLSSELATYVSGRYIELRMLPLSFKEYIEINPVSNEKSTESRFEDYLRYGALPIIRPDMSGPEYIKGQLEGVYNTVLVKDVATRLNLRNVDGIRKISKYLFSNVGNLTNMASIAEALKISDTTVKKYVTALGDAYLFYKANRFDVKGKKILESNEKYYASDTGIRNMMLGWSHGMDIGRLIENVVYLELIRRGYEVVVGNYRDWEIDFTASKMGDVEYYQVAQSIMDPSTAEREARSLDAVKDNYPKTILSMDRVKMDPGKGIRHVNVIDWLLGQ